MDVKKANLKLELEVHIPEDIIRDNVRYDNVKVGILRSIAKGLYDQGIDFRLIDSTFELKQDES